MKTIMMKRLAGLLLGMMLAASSGLAEGKLSAAEMKKLAASANTSADHLKLAQHYEAVAAEHEAEAKTHEALAEQYAKAPTGHEQKHPMSGKTAAHCRMYAEHCHKLSSVAKAMATEHRAAAEKPAAKSELARQAVQAGAALEWPRAVITLGKPPVNPGAVRFLICARPSPGPRVPSTCCRSASI